MKYDLKKQMGDKLVTVGLAMVATTYAASGLTVMEQMAYESKIKTEQEIYDTRQKKIDTFEYQSDSLTAHPDSLKSRKDTISSLTQEQTKSQERIKDLEAKIDQTAESQEKKAPFLLGSMILAHGIAIAGYVMSGKIIGRSDD